MKNIMIYIRRLGAFNRNARLFLFSTILNGLGISVFVLLYNLYILSLGFRQDMIGTLTAVASLVAVAAAVPMGWVGNRLGFKRSMFLGTVGSAVSVVLPLVSPTAIAFIGCELIWGVAFTLVVVVSSPFITENSNEEERPYLFSLQFVLTMFTTFLGCLLGGDLPRLLGGWLGANAESPVAYQAALWIGTGLMFISALPFLFLKRQQKQHAHAVQPRLRVQHVGQVSRLIVPGVIGALAGGMFVPFVNVFWKLSHNLNDAAIGQILAVSGLLMSILGLAAPMLGKKWGAVRVNVVTLLLSAVGLMLFGFSPFFMVALIGYLGRDMFVNVSRPLTQQFQMDRTAAEERNAVSSLYTMGINIAWGAGSFVSGILQADGWFWPVIVASAAFYLASGVSWQVLFGARRVRPSRSEAPALDAGLELEEGLEGLRIPAGVTAE